MLVVRIKAFARLLGWLARVRSIFKRDNDNRIVGTLRVYAVRCLKVEQKVFFVLRRKHFMVQPSTDFFSVIALNFNSTDLSINCGTFCFIFSNSVRLKSSPNWITNRSQQKLVSVQLLHATDFCTWQSQQVCRKHYNIPIEIQFSILWFQYWLLLCVPVLQKRMEVKRAPLFVVQITGLARGRPCYEVLPILGTINKKILVIFFSFLI